AALTCGAGPARAPRRTAAALARADAHAVLSVGTCGSLVDLPLGHVVTASIVTRDGAPCPTPTPWPAAALANVVTVAAPVWSPDRRAVLAAQGASVCEMEAAAVQAAAGALPFSALKVVSDQAGAQIDRCLQE
ncbi:unnamed protein product, partial [Ectocarpus fasciculatus]